MFSLASRVTYHPKLKFLPKFDTYAGGAIIVRFGHSKLPDETHSKWSADFSPVLGLRYYIAKRFAFTGEYAYDHTSNITLGFSILIN